MNQKEIQLYVSHRSWRCWQMRRLLMRRGYHFEVIDTTDDPTLRGWLALFAGRESMPYVFVDHRPVGGLGIPAFSSTWCEARCREPRTSENTPKAKFAEFHTTTSTV